MVPLESFPNLKKKITMRKEMRISGRSVICICPGVPVLQMSTPISTPYDRLPLIT